MRKEEQEVEEEGKKRKEAEAAEEAECRVPGLVYLRRKVWSPQWCAL